LNEKLNSTCPKEIGGDVGIGGESVFGNTLGRI
jgi:hypothetical protein